MTCQCTAQTNGQQKNEQLQASGILQRAAVRSLSVAGVHSAQAQEADPFRNSAISKDFSGVPISTIKPQQVMTKLMIGQPGDMYEREADAIASQVMSMSAVVQPEKSTPEQTNSQVASQALAAHRSLFVQTKGKPMLGHGLLRAGELESQLRRTEGGGRPLPEKVLAFMEPRMGVDLSDRRVHTSTQAQVLNKALGSQAFTYGKNIFYGAGKAPSNDHLTAHELAHTRQQSGEEVMGGQGEKQETAIPSFASINHQPSEGEKTSGRRRWDSRRVVRSGRVGLSQPDDARMRNTDVVQRMLTKGQDIVGEETGYQRWGRQGDNGDGTTDGDQSMKGEALHLVAVVVAKVLAKQGKRVGPHVAVMVTGKRMMVAINKGTGDVGDATSEELSGAASRVVFGIQAWVKVKRSEGKQDTIKGIKALEWVSDVGVGQIKGLGVERGSMEGEATGTVHGEMRLIPAMLGSEEWKASLSRRKSKLEQRDSDFTEAKRVIRIGGTMNSCLDCEMGHHGPEANSQKVWPGPYKAGKVSYNNDFHPTNDPTRMTDDKRLSEYRQVVKSQGTHAKSYVDWRYEDDNGTIQIPSQVSWGDKAARDSRYGEMLLQHVPSEWQEIVEISENW